VRGSSGVASKKGDLRGGLLFILFIRGGRRPYFFLIELISCAGVA
jgi:hypothetical protein